VAAHRAAHQGMLTLNMLLIATFTAIVIAAVAAAVIG
jgi:hypothetical protein